MKKMFLSAIGCLLLGAATAMAGNVLVVHLMSGETYNYVLSEEPVITFSGEKIIINTTNTEHQFSMEAVKFFNYELQNTTAIGEVTTDGMRILGDRIVFSGLPANSPIYLYDTGGQLYLKTAADADGNAVVELSSISKGVYIVKANNISTKITKK